MLTGLLILFSLTAVSQRTIYVKDNNIYTTCEEPVIMRGVNEMFIWSGDQTGVATLPEIAQTGANTVRLVWTTDGAPAKLDELINNCLKQNMIPVPELHDATGDFSQLQKLLDYWKKPEVLEIIQKYKQWIIVNIGNEIGGGAETNDQWEAYYKDAIDQLRGAGIDVPLMIDCGAYGSNEQYFLSKGNSLLDYDPLHNLIFSVHTYWIQPDSDQGRMDRLDNLIAEAKSKNLPFIIGEGPQKAASPWSTYCEVDFPYAFLLKRCQEEGIGWLSWSWGLVDNNDCGAPNSVFDITTDGKFGNWATNFAEEIMVTDPNSIKNTSVIPSSMTSGNCGVKCSPVELTSSSDNICLTGTSELSIVDASFLTSNHSVKWFLNNEEIPGESATSYTASEEGTYGIEIDSLGLCQVFDEVVVSASLPVDLGPDKTLCSSESVTLEFPVELEGNTYGISWYLDGVAWGPVSNSVSTNYEGTYVAQINTAYCEGKDTVIVSNNLPSVNDTIICKGVEETLMVNGGGNYVWYADEALSEKLFTGSDYMVVLEQPATFYIRDESGFEGTVGKLALDNSFWDTWDAESKTNKLGFEVFETLTVKTFDVYAQSAGSMNVVFYNSSFEVIETLPFSVTSGKNTLTINKEFSPGIYYADVAGSNVNLSFNHDEGDYNTAYPYILQNSGNTIISIDRTEPAWARDKPWYLFFYNWKIEQSQGSECLAQPMNVTLNDNCVTSIDDSRKTTTLAVFPNPTKGDLELSSPINWKLFSISGIFISEGFGKKVNMKGLENGMYVLQTEVKHFKIMKN